VVLTTMVSAGLWNAGCGEGPDVEAGDDAAGPVTVVPPADPGDMTDSDQDGLTDAQEAQLGTSPYLPDTDGDGFGDSEELLELAFDPQINPYRFNPRIADVPRVSIEVTGPPEVRLVQTTSEGEARTFDNTRATTQTEGFTTSSTDSTSVRTETSNTVGVEASYGTMWGVTGSYSHSWSESEETSFSWTDTQSSENSETLSASEGFSETSDVVSTGGTVHVPVDIRNEGYLTFTVQTIALGLRKIDPNQTDVIEIGQLEPASDRTFHTVTSLAPGEAIRGLVFDAEIGLERARTLLGEGPMAVRTLMYELIDADGRQYDHRYTQIAARTATITVDRGLGDPAVGYEVATHTPGNEGLPLSVALRDVLRLHYETGTTLWTTREGPQRTHQTLLSLDGVGTDSASGGYWVVEVFTDDGRGGQTQTYHPLETNLDLDAIRLRPAMSVQLVYVVDAERDGLGERAEMLLGLDPSAYDTDGDGIGDGDEVAAGTNPLVGLPTVRLGGAELAGRELTMRLRVSPGEVGQPRSVRVDWGDGSAAQLVPVDQALRGFTMSHRYTRDGEFEVTAGFADDPDAAATGDRLRVRLAEPLSDGWSVDVPDGVQVTDMAAGGGGVFLRTRERRGRTVHFGLSFVTGEGELAWSRELGTQRAEEMPWWWGAWVKLSVDDEGTAYVTDHHAVFAFDAEGQQLWRHETRALSVAAGGGGTVYVIGDGTAFHKRLSRLHEGAEVWTRIQSELGRGWMPTRMTVLADGQLVMGEMNVVSFATAGTVDRLRRMDGDGETLRVDEVAGEQTGVQLEGPAGRVILAGNNGNHVSGVIRAGVWCYGPDGELVWGGPLPPSEANNRFGSGAVDPAGRVYLVMTDWVDRGSGGLQRHTVWAYDASGLVLWRRPMADNSEPSMSYQIAADGDGLFAVGFDRATRSSTVRRLRFSDAPSGVTR
jgi:hypothetical protein